MRRSLFLACVVSLGLIAATASAQPSYFPEGPQTFVSEDTVFSGGWTLCHQDDYVDEGQSLSSILAGCQGTYMMLACRPIKARGEGFHLLAAALRSDVLTDAGANRDVTTTSNGSEWYFHELDGDFSSMGFADGGDAVDRYSCDTEATGDQDLRLCFHLNNGEIDDGYRCGAETNLGSGDRGSWERLILVSGAVPTVSRWHLLALALLLVAAALASRRMWARSS